MTATVDLAGIRPLMQATLAALFKFEMFDGVGDEQQTTPARACFISTDHRAKLSSRADAPLRSSRICHSPTAAFALISPIIASLA